MLRADVSGQVLMRVYLSGMPECKFGLNDRFVLEKGAVSNRDIPLSSSASSSTRSALDATPTSVELDDAHFHQCVKLANFEENRTITFIPPDGEFELMRFVVFFFFFSHHPRVGPY
jgi:AP-2 complex subunit mu-1